MPAQSKSAAEFLLRWETPLVAIGTASDRGSTIRSATIDE
jgi:hypothetical protein